MENRIESVMSLSVILAAALCLMILPLKWLLCMAAAAAIHELSHCLACAVCGESASFSKIGVHGMVLHCGPLSWDQSVLCSLAGPAGSLCCLAFRNVLPELAAIGCVQGLYNLLPIWPLDGGRALHAVLCRFLGEQMGERVFRKVNFAVLAALIPAACILSARLHRWMLLPALFPLIRENFGCYTCFSEKEMI